MRCCLCCFIIKSSFNGLKGVQAPQEDDRRAWRQPLCATLVPSYFVAYSHCMRGHVSAARWCMGQEAHTSQGSGVPWLQSCDLVVHCACAGCSLAVQDTKRIDNSPSSVNENFALYMTVCCLQCLPQPRKVQFSSQTERQQLALTAHPPAQNDVLHSLQTIFLSTNTFNINQ